MKPAKNERQLTDRVIREVKKVFPDAWYLKVHGNGYQRGGIPDLLFCVKGRFVAVEMKHQKPGESLEHMRSRLHPLQKKELNSIAGAGGVAVLAWTVDQVIDALRSAEEEADHIV